MGSAEIGLYVALHLLQDRLETLIGHLTGDVQQAACNNPIYLKKGFSITTHTAQGNTNIDALLTNCKQLIVACVTCVLYRGIHNNNPAPFLQQQYNFELPQLHQIIQYAADL